MELKCLYLLIKILISSVFSKGNSIVIIPVTVTTAMFFLFIILFSQPQH